MVDSNLSLKTNPACSYFLLQAFGAAPTLRLQRKFTRLSRQLNVSKAKKGHQFSERIRGSLHVSCSRSLLHINGGVLFNVGNFKHQTAAAWIRNGVSNNGLEELTKASLNSSYIPALTAYEYRGHIITAWARPEFTNGSTSVGIVYKRARLGSIIQVQRIEGQLFETKEQAEQHGVELCKQWIDKQVKARADDERAVQYVQVVESF